MQQGKIDAQHYQIPLTATLKEIRTLDKYYRFHHGRKRGPTYYLPFGIPELE
jgi:hypothetical protein